jgi:CheY-like chemotaxis protein
MLTVRDTGHGMNESVLSHIFEPFFTTKDRTKGTGLGLSTVYGTLRQSGGCIAVSSKVGEGTAFEVYLPRVEEPLDEYEVPVPKPEAVAGVETILVVEDDDAVRRITREFLKINGYHVIEADSGDNAIQLMKLHKDSIDLVLTDVLMPEMNGHTLMERLAEVRPGIKVLYMSAYTEDAAINIGALQPGTEFLEKPVSPDELANKVRKVLTRTDAKD